MILYLKNRIPFILLTVCFLLSAYPDSRAQSRETLIKAGYIEKFTHFVEWPASSNVKPYNDIFTIAIIGYNNISKTLNDIFTKSDSEDIEYKIVEINTIEQIKECKILFISDSEKNNLEEILEYTNGKPILTISDSKGFGEKGVIINMFQEGNYIRYEINRKTLNESGLIINSLLLNYAVIIGTND